MDKDYLILSMQNGLCLVEKFCCICQHDKTYWIPLDDLGFNPIKPCPDCSRYVSIIDTLGEIINGEEEE
jgi:hypothetical protein